MALSDADVQKQVGDLQYFNELGICQLIQFESLKYSIWTFEKF